MINTQPIEKLSRAPGTSLDIQGIFPTIQGEGPFTGVPAVFVRLAGCNLQCPMCDTDYTSKRQILTVKEIVAAVKSALGPGIRLVVITGGEPFRQDIIELCSDLLVAGYFVQVETNGTLPPPSLFLASMVNHRIHERRGVYIVVSPKTGKVNPITASLACAIKYVLDYDNIHTDGLPTRALGHSAHPILWRPLPGSPESQNVIYLQPADHKEDGLNKMNTDAVIESCLAHGYTLQLQTHKVLDLE